MVDIILEIIRATILFILVLWLWKHENRYSDQAKLGWNYILAGFSLLLFGNILDITDNFEQLNWLIVVGDTEVQSFLEKFVGSLGGFLLLTTGLILWIPKVQSLSDEIFQRKNAQQALEEQAKELILSKEEAQKANHAKSEFLANISHELRTPMHGILGYSDIGLKQCINNVDPHKKNYSHINDSAKRLMHLIDDLLDLAKLESGKMEMSFTQHSLVTLTKLRIKEQQARLDSLTLYISIDDQCDSCIAEIDTLRIGQVITNLLSNAINYSTSGDNIKILIKNDLLQATDNKTKPALLFSMKDQGQGIPENEFDIIFERFSQSSVSNPSVIGTGLGLPICYDIIQAHSGKIWAENHPQGGAQFKFIIPVNQA